MKRLITLGTAVAAGAALAACGGANGGRSANTSGPGVSTARAKTVAVRQLPRVGRVLVAQNGEALYSPDLEAGSKIVCAGACNSFWKPLTLSGGKPIASAGAGKLGLIKRPDGSRQVTVNGKPLYTFSEDSPGKATGNGFRDEFGGHHFTWNVIGADGSTTGGGGSGSGGSTPRTTTGSGGGYGY
ncbi:MAG: hypothetical protein JO342_14365 [Solirubrobacterales bacterium]|nr:hypothetical protein [Solirubrobacterales bacterium]